MVEENKKQMQLDQLMTNEEKRQFNEGVKKENEKYCYCKGMGSGDFDDFYLGCDQEDKCV